MDRRTFLLSVVLLPLVATPSQWGGYLTYNCDEGESAFAEWAMGAPGTVVANWHYLEPDGPEIAVSSYTTDRAQYVTGYFFARSYQQLQQVYWFATTICEITNGSCII